jgi:streptogramin lyase
VLVLGSEPHSPAGRIAGRPLSLKLSPASFTVGEGGVWFSDSTTVTRVDPRTAKVAARITPRLMSDATFKVDTSTLAVGAGAVWIDAADNTVLRLDPKTGKAVAEVRVPPDSGQRLLAADDRSVWVLSQGKGTLTRIDPRDNKAFASPRVKNAALLIAGEGVAYVLKRNLDLVSINPAETPTRPQTLATKVNEAAFDKGVLYLESNGRVVPTYAGTDIKGRAISLGAGAIDFATGAGALWAEYLDRSVKRFDERSGKLIGKAIKLSQTPGGIRVGDGGVWVISRGSMPTLTHIRP